MLGEEEASTLLHVIPPPASSIRWEIWTKACICVKSNQMMSEEPALNAAHSLLLVYISTCSNTHRDCRYHTVAACLNCVHVCVLAEAWLRWGSWHVMVSGRTPGVSRRSRWCQPDRRSSPAWCLPWTRWYVPKQASHSVISFWKFIVCGVMMINWSWQMSENEPQHVLISSYIEFVCVFFGVNISCLCEYASNIRNWWHA